MPTRRTFARRPSTRSLCRAIAAGTVALAMAPGAEAAARSDPAAARRDAATTPSDPAAARRDGATTSERSPMSPSSPEPAMRSEPEPSRRGTSSERRTARRRALAQYLERPVRMGPHYVDHGVLQVAAAGGWPHRYRLALSLGVLDHFTIGATAHWLPGQRAPRVSPVVAVAFFRNHLFETGVRHFWSLFPPPADDTDPATPSYQGSAQWTLAHASFGQAWVTGGFDAGVVRARVDDPGQDPDAMGNNPSITTWRFGGGLHLRVGTRRWGFTAQVLVPQVLAELRLDLRFGLFERRRRGGWRPTGVVEDWDRPAPW